MKNKSIAALLALAVSALCQAGERVPSVFIAVGYSPHQPAARMKVPADYVAVPLNIQNDSRDPAKRADEIEKTLRALAEKLAPHPDLKIMPGVVSLSPRELSKLSSDSQAGSAQLYVLKPVKFEDLTHMIHELLDVNACLLSTQRPEGEPEDVRAPAGAKQQPAG